MISCGPLERRDNGDPLWTKRGLAERAYTVPDRFRVEARTTAGEVAEIAHLVDGKLNSANGPVKVMVSTLGWSSLSVEGTDLHDPQSDAAFVPALRKYLDASIPGEEVSAELNSRSFGRLLAKNLDELIQEDPARSVT